MSRLRAMLQAHPLLIIPELAEKIGGNEAIVLKQIDFWLQLNERENRNFLEERYWTYNTYEQWKTNNFTWMSIPTIRRVFTSLKKQGLIETTSLFNKMNQDNTLWTTINYDALDALEGCDQNDQTACSDRSDSVINVARAIPETTTETTTETCKEVPKGPSLKNKNKKVLFSDVKDFLSYFLSGEDELHTEDLLILASQMYQNPKKKEDWDMDILRDILKIGMSDEDTGKALPKFLHRAIHNVYKVLNKDCRTSSSFLKKRAQYDTLKTNFRAADLIAGFMYHKAPDRQAFLYRHNPNDRIEQQLNKFYLTYLHTDNSRYINLPSYLDYMVGKPDFNYSIKSLISPFWIEHATEEGWT